MKNIARVAPSITQPMTNYDFTNILSPIDFEILSKDLLEADLDIRLENFRDGRDKGIDLRYAPAKNSARKPSGSKAKWINSDQPELIVQCKRYATFSSLKSALKNVELEKIAKLNPKRYILTTSASLGPQQSDDLKSPLCPFIQSTGDIYGRERLNSILERNREIERRHLKLWVRKPAAGLIHHADRGPQYRSGAYLDLLAKNGIQMSMNGRKVPQDNAVAESFFSTLKNELIHHVDLNTRSQAIALITDYIEQFYNRRRIHQSLGYCTPEQFEKQYRGA